MDVDLPNSLKRCSSAPTINNLATTTSNTTSTNSITSQGNMAYSTTTAQGSNLSSRESSPAPILNIFAPRARRYSASFASLGANVGNGPRLTPRVSQLRQEECADMNSREVNHEREIHSAMQMSQSWEDLTLVAENWSCKSDDVTNPLQVCLPSGTASCSSPSPTSRTGMRLPYGLSPSPTRRTFATRRSMSPIAMRPSQLGPVKRKFELDDSNWNTYSPPPLKKMLTESRGPSPICQSPSSVCPSPDSGTYEGRITPKLFVSKLYTNSTNSSSSLCSSPMVPSPVMEIPVDLQGNCHISPTNTASSSSSSEPMNIMPCDGDTGSGEHNHVEIKLTQKFPTNIKSNNNGNNLIYNTISSEKIVNNNKNFQMKNDEPNNSQSEITLKMTDNYSFKNNTFKTNNIGDNSNRKCSLIEDDLNSYLN